MLEFESCPNCGRQIPCGVAQCKCCDTMIRASAKCESDRFVFRKSNRLGTLISLTITMIAFCIATFVAFIGLLGSLASNEILETQFWGLAVTIGLMVIVVIHLNLRGKLSEDGHD